MTCKNVITLHCIALGSITTALITTLSLSYSTEQTLKELPHNPSRSSNLFNKPSLEAVRLRLSVSLSCSALGLALSLSSSALGLAFKFSGSTLRLALQLLRLSLRLTSDFLGFALGLGGAHAGGLFGLLGQLLALLDAGDGFG
jgi:hypothetical protein